MGGNNYDPVATVLTVYGIETGYYVDIHGMVLLLSCNSTYRLRYWNLSVITWNYCWLVLLQQYLPFTVLKLNPISMSAFEIISSCNSTYRLRYWNEYNECVPALTRFVATVLTVYGIETHRSWCKVHTLVDVATVLTVYGIETKKTKKKKADKEAKLQQYLPFTVLKQYIMMAHNKN